MDDQDSGSGCALNLPQLSAAHDKARKEAVSDGLKRAFRQFGESLGNCVYDSDFRDRLLPRIKKQKASFAPLNAIFVKHLQKPDLGDDDLIRASDVYGHLNEAPMPSVPIQSKPTDKPSGLLQRATSFPVQSQRGTCFD